MSSLHNVYQYFARKIRLWPQWQFFRPPCHLSFRPMLMCRSILTSLRYYSSVSSLAHSALSAWVTLPLQKQAGTKNTHFQSNTCKVHGNAHTWRLAHVMVESGGSCCACVFACYLCWPWGLGEAAEPTQALGNRQINTNVCLSSEDKNEDEEHRE